MTALLPTPSSPAALAMGCTCPDDDCPLHAVATVPCGELE